MKQRRIVSVARLGDLLHFGHLLLTFGDFLLVTLPIIRGKKKSHKNYFFFKKKWAIPGLFFLYFCLFNTQLTVNKCSIYK